MPDGYVITCGAELAREETYTRAHVQAMRMAADHVATAYIYSQAESGELTLHESVPDPEDRGSIPMPPIPGLERGKPRPSERSMYQFSFIENGTEEYVRVALHLTYLEAEAIQKWVHDNTGECIEFKGMP